MGSSVSIPGSCVSTKQKNTISEPTTHIVLSSSSQLQLHQGRSRSSRRIMPSPQDSSQQPSAQHVNSLVSNQKTSNNSLTGNIASITNLNNNKKHFSSGDAQQYQNALQQQKNTKSRKRRSSRIRSFSLRNTVSALFNGNKNSSKSASRNELRSESGSNDHILSESEHSTKNGHRNILIRAPTATEKSFHSATSESVSSVTSSNTQSAHDDSSTKSSKRKRSKTLPPLSHILGRRRHNSTSSRGSNSGLTPVTPNSPRSSTISQIEDEELFSLKLETRHVDSAAIGRDEDGNKTVNDYTILHTLGAGAYGKVKLCMDARNRAFAIKILNKSLLGRIRQQGGGNALENVKREVAILKRLRHPNIVRLFEVIDDPQNDKMFLVMEAIKNGPVVNMNEDGTSSEVLSEKKARQYMYDILQGLEYLHSQGIIHHDIKPENLLVDGSDNVKLTDFGVSQDVSNNDTDAMSSVSSRGENGEEEDEFSRATYTGGTPAFSPPEVAAGQIPFDGKIADIWSLGVTLYVFVFGLIPFEGSSMIEIYKHIRNDKLQIPDSPEISLELRDLLERMLEKDPTKRITLEGIQQHPWMNGGNIDLKKHTMNGSEINNKASDVTNHDVQNAIREGSLSGADKLVLLISLKSRLAKKAREIRSRSRSRSLLQNADRVGQSSSGSLATSSDAAVVSPRGMDSVQSINIESVGSPVHEEKGLTE